MARRLKKTSGAPSAAENRERLEALGSVAKELEDWRPQAEVLRHIEAVPTNLVQYDRAVGVGGHPIGRFTLTHGPSNEGKTAFCLALIASFLRRGHFAGMADAERTTPQPWVRTMLGELADHPGFVALPVRSFEQVRKGTRRLCDRVADAREKGRIPPDTTGLIVVDSIRKLVPEKLWDNLTKSLSDPKKDKGVDGFGGRAGQIKAALNAAWVDELIPLLADTRMAMVVVARETRDEPPLSSLFAPQKDWKTGGGSALFYEASLDVRVTRDWVYEPIPGSKSKRVVGERCCLEIHKTKVAGKTEKVPRAHFHTSNGVSSQAGFDPARDLLELGRELGVVELRGASYRVGGEVLGQGEAKALERLRDPAWFRNVELEVRRAMP